MPIIQVNHQVLRSAAEEIEEYCEIQDRELKHADADVKQMLRTDWIGPDAMEFGGKWEAVDSEDSVSKKFSDSLRAYSKALKASANSYQEAQETACNLAAMLPR